MNKVNALLLILQFIAMTSFSQDRKLNYRIYASPILARSFIQNSISDDVSFRLTGTNNPTSLQFGGGLELLYKLNSTWFLDADFSFLPKGSFETKNSIIRPSNFVGTVSNKTSVFFLQTTIAFEKRISLNNPIYQITISPGLFYGIEASNLIGFGLLTTNNDIGFSTGLGLLRKQTSFKIVYEKGLADIDKIYSTVFKTNVLIFKFGYLFQ